MMLIISLLGFIVATKLHLFVRIASTVSVTILFMGAVIGTAIHNVTLFSSINDFMIAWKRAMPTSMLEWLFGSGLNASGGGLIVNNSGIGLSVDGGWVLILKMMGIVGFIVIICFILVLVVYFYRLTLYSTLPTDYKKLQILGFTAGTAAFGLLAGSAHEVVIMRPVVDILFYTLAASMTGVYSYISNKDLSLAQGKI